MSFFERPRAAAAAGTDDNSGAYAYTCAYASADALPALGIGKLRSIWYTYAGADAGSHSGTYTSADTPPNAAADTRADAGANATPNAAADTSAHTSADTTADTTANASADTVADAVSGAADACAGSLLESGSPEWNMQRPRVNMKESENMKVCIETPTRRTQRKRWTYVVRCGS